MNLRPRDLVNTLDISNLSLIESEQLGRCMMQGFSLDVPALRGKKLPAAKSATWDMFAMDGDA